jgi:hypothetical protein
MGLVIERMEDNDELQDAVLTVHHTCMQTLSATPTVKIIENHRGVAFVKSAQAVPVQMQVQ